MSAVVIPTNEVAETPKGSPFFVDQCPFRFGEQIDFEALDIDDDKVLNWPMVYILANENSAYVGQTTSVATRMSQHGANEEKRDFNTANIIFNEEFNASVITDYEHRLIGYMHADGRYRLTNKNDGMTDTNYFSKAAYVSMFDDLWETLRRLELADHTISEIEESEVFKYSPYKGLNTDQRVALDKILAAIGSGLEGSKPIVVEGMPGTGKTVLAVFLLKMLRDDPKFKDMNVRIVEPVTALRNTLGKSLANVSGLNPLDVISPNDLIKPAMGYERGSKSFDIVLVDEAHKLKRRVNLGTQFGNYDKVNKELGLPKEATQLDWVINQAKLPIFFYDPLQSVGPSCLDRDQVVRVLGDSIKNSIRLESQMRVKGGDSYLRYVRGLLEGTQRKRMDFKDYELVLHDDFADFVASFESTFDKHNLSRMVAGYAWKWVSRKDPCASDIVIGGVGLKWNRTYDNWVGLGVDDSEIAHEVGCIHSIQGYDLSYAYVILGGDIVLNDDGCPESNKKGYFDRNGFATATKEELDRYIKNIYYVLLTRGIQGTHIYVVDPGVREYPANFVPVV